jgi:maleylpyruvate isomerase
VKLHGFFRSGSSHRLRIALNLKGLMYEYIAVNLRSEEHLSARYKALNPQGFVPTLEADGQVLIQSPAVIEWLEERYPTPALLPADSLGRARARAFAAIVGCDIHPVNNRRILEYLRGRLGCDQVTIDAWCATWITAGFDAIEALLAADQARGNYCVGHAPTLADVYLVPQVESARRFRVDVSRWPRISAIDAACSQLDAFRVAAPALQPDAVSTESGGPFQ